MRVAHTHPATWRGRTITQAIAELDLHAAAVATVRRLTDGGHELFRRLKAVSPAVLIRVHKGRSETQPPSALERLWEELIALYFAGVAPHQLRLAAIETLYLLERLEAGDDVSLQRLLGSIHDANLTSNAEALAESLMHNHGSRALDIGDAERLADATRADIAAKKLQLLRLEQYIAKARGDRAGMRVVRGSLA